MSEAEKIARLKEALAWTLANMRELKKYMERPDNGDYGTECAVCMGEWFDQEALLEMDNARQLLDVC